MLYLPQNRARIQLQDYSVTTQGIENVQVFKSENTLTSCKIPNFLQSQTTKFDYQPATKEPTESIEHKLKEYTRKARCKAHDPLKQVSEADRRFRTYIENNIDSLTMMGPW